METPFDMSRPGVLDLPFGVEFQSFGGNPLVQQAIEVMALMRDSIERTALAEAAAKALIVSLSAVGYYVSEAPPNG